MKIVDLTHFISPNMPVYPGTEPPTFTTECAIEAVGFLEKKMNLYSHTGTHIDAPAHIIRGARTLDQLSADTFIGNAFSVDLTRINGPAIDISALEPHENSIKKNDFILLNTGWSRYWGTERYFADYPVLSPEAAVWLNGFELKGLGLDVISPDRVESKDFPIHRILLERNMIIIENLTNLQALPGSEFMFLCFPLKIEQADGSPVRAVAIIT